MRINKKRDRSALDLWRFDRASETETTVYGSCRPGYPSSRVPDEIVRDWISDMREAGIARVVCLLEDTQLGYYDDLPACYYRAFGAGKVLLAPVPDYSLADPILMEKTILPFLRAAEEEGEGVVVHCSGGYGRTGHVLAVWLVAVRGFPSRAAIAAVKSHGRSPAEALGGDEEALAAWLARFAKVG